MAVDVTVMGKQKVAYGVEVAVKYICPHCHELVTEDICFSEDIENCIAEVNNHECLECGEENDLEVDFY